jgi:hypothetical protein
MECETDQAVCLYEQAAIAEELGEWKMMFGVGVGVFAPQDSQCSLLGAIGCPITRRCES